MPRQSFSTKDIEKLLNGGREVEVVEVATQRGCRMPLEQFLKYYKSVYCACTFLFFFMKEVVFRSKKAKQQRLLNLLSLEFSMTDMEKVF